LSPKNLGYVLKLFVYLRFTKTGYWHLATERPYTIHDSLIIATVPESNKQKDVHRTLFRKWKGRYGIHKS